LKIKIFLLISLCLCLQSCVSTMQMNRLADGKSKFEAGDFKDSFHILLPLAAEGNAHAEYAIGYMYYYGYGVPMDTESGIFWMQKSAAQKYEPAQKALDLILHNIKN
jgi:TPR repeat protein